MKLVGLVILGCLALGMISTTTAPDGTTRVAVNPPAGVTLGDGRPLGEQIGAASGAAASSAVDGAVGGIDATTIAKGAATVVATVGGVRAVTELGKAGADRIRYGGPITPRGAVPVRKPDTAPTPPPWVPTDQDDPPPPPAPLPNGTAITLPSWSPTPVTAAATERSAVTPGLISGLADIARAAAGLPPAPAGPAVQQAADVSGTIVDGVAGADWDGSHTSPAWAGATAAARTAAVAAG